MHFLIITHVGHLYLCLLVIPILSLEKYLKTVLLTFHTAAYFLIEWSFSSVQLLSREL